MTHRDPCLAEKEHILAMPGPKEKCKVIPEVIETVTKTYGDDE